MVFQGILKAMEVTFELYIYIKREFPSAKGDKVAEDKKESQMGGGGDTRKINTPSSKHSLHFCY